jgi:hypothetical protein
MSKYIKDTTNWHQSSLVKDVLIRNQWKLAYQIAITQLDEEEKKEIDLGTCTVHSVLEAADKARAEREDNKWRYRKKNGEVIVLRDGFDKIIEGFSKYADTLNTALRHQPEAASLVWASARSLVQVNAVISSEIPAEYSFYHILALSES